MKLTTEEENLVKAHRKKAELEKARAWKPKLANEYTTEEKCNSFDELHKMVFEHYSEVAKTKFANEDFAHWCFEAMMHLLGDDVWHHYNKLQ